MSTQPRRESVPDADVVIKEDRARRLLNLDIDLGRIEEPDRTGSSSTGGIFEGPGVRDQANRREIGDSRATWLRLSRKLPSINDPRSTVRQIP